MNFRMCDYSILSEKFPYSLYIISGDQPNRESNIEINSVLLALKMIWKFIGKSCVILNYQFSGMNLDTGLHIRHRFSKWHIFVLVIAMLIIIIPSHDGIQKGRSSCIYT